MQVADQVFAETDCLQDEHLHLLIETLQFLVDKIAFQQEFGLWPVLILAVVGEHLFENTDVLINGPELEPDQLRQGTYFPQLDQSIQIVQQIVLHLNVGADKLRKESIVCYFSPCELTDKVALQVV